MANKKVTIDLPLEDLLDLKEPNKKTLEYDLMFVIENGIEEYIKKNEKEKKSKDDFVEMLFDQYIYNKLKNRLIRDGFVYQCKFCWGMDVSGQYGKATKPKHK